MDGKEEKNQWYESFMRELKWTSEIQERQMLEIKVSNRRPSKVVDKKIQSEMRHRVSI